MEAPSALAAALASSAALPRPPRARLTRPTPRALRGYVNPYVNGYANPYVNPPPRVAYPTAPPALASAQARAPLGGEDASALDPSDSRTAVWKPPAAAIDQFSRPAAAWSARNFRAPSARRHLRWRSDFNQPRQGTFGTSPAVTSGSSPAACSACDDPSVTGGARSAVTIRLSPARRSAPFGVAVPSVRAACLLSGTCPAC